jgi:hypothetical protein
LAKLGSKSAGKRGRDSDTKRFHFLYSFIYLWAGR